jgi:hypothetical protein
MRIRIVEQRPGTMPGGQKPLSDSLVFSLPIQPQSLQMQQCDQFAGIAEIAPNKKTASLSESPCRDDY